MIFADNYCYLTVKIKSICETNTIAIMYAEYDHAHKVKIKTRKMVKITYPP